MENNLAFVKDLIASCFVPELTVDVDNTPIEAGHFDVHRKFVELQLPLLLDFVQQKNDWLCSNEDDEFTVEVKGGFLLLTSEITAHSTLYRIRNDHFLEVLDTFLQKHFHKILDSSHEVEKYILKHYTQYLKANIWKRHIGTVHGFSRFLQLKVEGGRTLPFTWANFALSVGLTLRECHLPEYKGLSTSIFQIIISHSDPKEIKDVNIPEVIFDALLNSVRTVESAEDTYAVWKCLCDCLDFNEDIDSWDWDMTDEMMENLLGSLKHTTKSDIIICLLYFIPKVLLRFTPNRKQIEEFLVRDYDSLSDDDFQKLRTEGSKISSCASYRWALYILKLFVGESHMFMQSAAVCEKMLQRFHMCYLTSIFIITVEVMNVNLLKFYEQFPNILMEAIATHNGTPRIRELVRQIYNTFIDHLEKSDLEDVTKDFQQYHKAFKQFVAEQC